MSIPNRLCSLNLLLVTLFVLAGVAILLAILPKGQFQQQQPTKQQPTKQQAAAETIRQRGGTIVLGPSRQDGLPPDVINVMLIDALVDAELMQNKVHVHDLHATILHLLDLDHERLTLHYAGRDCRLTDVHGRVVREVLA